MKFDFRAIFDLNASACAEFLEEGKYEGFYPRSWLSEMNRAVENSCEAAIK
ncbi:MAG: hypothetical protein K9J17_08505 [Flavobacteriales bacterium]|nr:hypothetical protein [Flavobacteriales bacterium]